MSRRRAAVAAILFLCVSFAPTIRSAEQTLISAGAIWKYNDAGVDLGVAWRGVGYNDSAWLSGPAQLGYGDGGEATLLSFGPDGNNKHITAYLRHTFSVVDPNALTALTLRFVRDDGVVIYVNGNEVHRSNMPAGPIAFSTLAPVAISGADEETFQQVALSPSVLTAGNNVIAVELHQQSVTSTDIGFDLELSATGSTAAAPVVELETPANGAVENTGALTFTAEATAHAGLASATLYVGGPPQTLTFTGQSELQDAQITADTPATPNGSGASVNVDGLTPHAHGLMKFPTLVGDGAGQVPAGAVIVSATLQINCTNPGQSMAVYRLTEDWVENEATWNQRAFGVAWGAPGADGAASNAQVPVGANCTTTGLRSVDLTRFVQEWSSGAPNFGVVFVDAGTDGVDFDSSESAASPVLSVTYRSTQTPMASQSLSGTSAFVEFPVNLATGVTYYWNVAVTDLLGRTSWAPADFVLTLDAAAPNAPVVVSPPDFSNGVSLSPTLSAVVSSPSGGPVTATFELRRGAGEEFTIIALPDTQHYSEAFPDIFTAQTQWIANNKHSRNIVFVTHEGDVVENQSTILEWQRANTSMSILDGVVPYGIGPGNHDLPTTNFNIYFPWTRYAGQPWYGGHMGTTNDNNYQLFSAGGLDFVIVHMVFCPPAAAVAWADGVFKSYPNRIGIVTTHAYLNEAAQRTTHGCASTQYLWDGLAVPNPNLWFMLSGHVHDESRRTDIANDHPVYQMLADYQGRASGGEGWLRILRFVPGEGKVYVQTYSPWLNAFESDANSQFTLDFPMGGEFAPAGTTTVPSGATASVPVGGLDPNTTYEWRVTVTNAAGKSRTGPVWSFTTASAPTNQPPVATGQSISTPEDTAAAITLGATDADGHPLTFSIASGPAHGTLTGTGANRVYTPAANYSGPDSFTFTAHDGTATSNLATVSITVQPVNDAPTAGSDSYSVQSGSVLSRPAPGVLGNDADVDGPSLSAQLVTGVSHGTLGLTDSGAFTYTPAIGFSGLDAFTYVASDGFLSSAAVTVSITVTAAPPAGPIFTANFNAGQDSFSYLDDAFRGTSQPSFASGSRLSSGGFSGGALRVELGGVNKNAAAGMSGGWRRTFTLTAATNVALVLRYNLTQSGDYEADDVSQVLAAIDGALVPGGGAITQIAGNGNGGAAVTTGWVQIEIPLGMLAAGSHTVVIGGYNNKKDGKSELTTVLIDDVSLIVK